MKSIHFNRLTKLLGLVVLLTCMNTCSRNPVTGKKQVMFMSEAQEQALGDQSDPQIVTEYGEFKDARLQSFIDQKGQEMAAISHRNKLTYKFRILDSPVINAFALPGGYVYFTRGILAHFNNEAELAGVLGHEIGHITARHSASQATKQTLASIFLIGGMILVPQVAEFAEELSQGVGLLFLKFSRDNESQSDQLGVEYSTKIGYDAHHMANFFKTLGRLSDQGGGRIPTFLSTHPDPGDRYTQVTKLATEAQKKIPGSTLVGRESYLAMLEGLIYGEDPRQGYAENQVFYHPEMLFQFPIPSEWKTINSPSQVQMAPTDGKALLLLTLSSGKSLEEAAQLAIQNYKLTVQSQERATVNGLTALAMRSEQIDQQDPNATVRVLSYFILYNNLIYEFHGVSTKTEYARYELLFLNTMRGFRKLSDQSKIQVTPDLITLKKVDRQATLKDLFISWKIPEKRHEELAIVNSMQLTDVIPPGTIIKAIKK